MLRTWNRLVITFLLTGASVSDVAPQLRLDERLTIASLSASDAQAFAGVIRPENTSVGTERTITLADDGKTIELKTGDRVLIQLSAAFDWTLDPYDTEILKSVKGAKELPKGAQALLEATKSGTTTVSLDGDPQCLKSTPPCALQSRHFKVSVVVD
ncbi:MAG TPA: hypothetical protein VEZ90_08515 [Blastocatellia bacterium]|nr:hypothetical protein [Blastocatellia bacterium]